MMMGVVRNLCVSALCMCVCVYNSKSNSGGSVYKIHVVCDSDCHYLYPFCSHGSHGELSFTNLLLCIQVSASETLRLIAKIKLHHSLL